MVFISLFALLSYGGTTHIGEKKVSLVDSKKKNSSIDMTYNAILKSKKTVIDNQCEMIFQTVFSLKSCQKEECTFTALRGKPQKVTKENCSSYKKLKEQSSQNAEQRFGNYVKLDIKAKLFQLLF